MKKLLILLFTISAINLFGQRIRVTEQLQKADTLSTGDSLVYYDGYIPFTDTTGQQRYIRFDSLGLLWSNLINIPNSVQRDFAVNSIYLDQNEICVDVTDNISQISTYCVQLPRLNGMFDIVNQNQSWAVTSAALGGETFIDGVEQFPLNIRSVTNFNVSTYDEGNVILDADGNGYFIAGDTLALSSADLFVDANNILFYQPLTTDNTQLKVLVRDTVTGKLKERDVSSIVQNIGNSDLTITDPARILALDGNYFEIGDNSVAQSGYFSLYNDTENLDMFQNSTQLGHFVDGTEKARIRMEPNEFELQVGTLTEFQINTDPGVAGQVFTTQGPGLPPFWGDQCFLSMQILSIISNYTISLNDGTILIDGDDIILTLPDPAVAYSNGCGRSYSIKWFAGTGTNPNPIGKPLLTTPSGLIYDFASQAGGTTAQYLFSNIGESLTIQSDGANWHLFH